MLRRYETLVGGGALRCTRCKFARCLPLGIAFLALVLGGPTAAAPSPEPKPTPQTLWEAFPVNPTGDRLAPHEQARADRSAQPTGESPGTETGPSDVAEAAAETPSGSGNVVFLVLLAGMGVLALLAVVTFASVRLRAGFSTRARHPWHIAWARRSTSASTDRAPGLARLDPQGVTGDIARAERISVPKPFFFTTALARRPHLRRRTLHAVLSQARVFQRIGRRTREVVWTEDMAAKLVGCALAIFAAFLSVHYVG